MVRPWSLAEWVLLAGLVAGGAGCHKAAAPAPPPAAPPPHPHLACALDRGRCERLCQGCDDRDDCFYRGGECLRRQGAVVFKKDTHDGGDDVFTGGCHYTCADEACTQSVAFLAGDACLDATKIAEWTQSRPHDSCLSVYDCDGECKRRGKGGGVCKPLPELCGAGRASAACTCS